MWCDEKMDGWREKEEGEEGEEGWERGGKGGGKVRGQRMSPKDHRFVKDVGVDFDGRNHDVISFLPPSLPPHPLLLPPPSPLPPLSLFSFFDAVGDVEY